MTCDEARESFTDLYDGRLGGAALVDLDQHLEACPACRGEWDAFLGAIQMVAELGTAEPSPGFAARVRDRIEAPTWWQRAVHAMFFPLQVKIPIQAVAVAVVAFVGVMLYQKSPEMQAQRRLTSTESSSARPAATAGGPQGANSLATPPASQPPQGGEAAFDRRASPGPESAARPAEPVERLGAAQDAPAWTAKVAPAPEQDRADAVTGKLDAAKPPPKVGAAPAPRKEAGESEKYQYAAPQPEAAPAPPPARSAAPPSTPVPEAARRRAQAPLREEAQEQEKALGKEVVPAETGKRKLPETRDEFRGYMESESKDADLKVPKSAPAPSDAGRRALARPPAAPTPPAAAAPEPPPAEEPRLRALVQPEEGLAVVPRGSADDLYSAGLTEYARQAYDRSAGTFRAFLAQYPQDARAPDARYWLADSHFQQQRYAEAIPEYEAVIRQFPESRRAPAALFRQGQARLALGDRAGCQNLRDVVGRFPRTREAGQAREALAARCP